MEAVLLYMIKWSVCLSLLCLGFVLLLRNTTWFRFNRSVLLWGCLVSLLLPFVQIELEGEALLRIPVETIRFDVETSSDATQASGEGEGVAAPLPTGVSPVGIVSGVYLLGCLTVCGMAVLSFVRIRGIIRRSVCCAFGSYRLYVSAEQRDSFSWGNSIVIPQELYESGRGYEEILLHERAHLHHRHSRDVLLIQLLTILHWFNPFVWLLRREWLDLHEYQADNDVIHQGINATQYQLLLVRKAAGSRLYILANGFNHSKLKKRISMMLKKRTNRWAQLRMLLFAPLVAGAIYSFATNAPKGMEQDLKWAYPVVKSTLAGAYSVEGKWKHQGIDMKADEGSEIRAAFDGVVVSSTSDRGYGKRIVVKHADGMETSYAHNSKNLAKEGEAVKAGQVIALVGNTGRCTAPHCHFEIRKEGVSIDPETIFDVQTQSLRSPSTIGKSR